MNLTHALQRFIGLTSTCPDLDYTITTQADIDAITNCSLVRGDLTLDSASGSIYLPYPTDVGGNVYIRNNSHLQSLIFDVQSIGGSLVVQNASALTTLLTLSLHSIQEVVLQNAPLLSSWGEPNAVVLYTMTIEGTLLPLIELEHVETMDEARISNNPNLTSIDLPALKNITNYLFVQENNPEISIMLDELQWANNISSRDVGKIDLPKIYKINNTLEISDSLVDTIELPKLAYAGGGLYFLNNKNLSYIGAPDLNSVGGATITILNNLKLASPGNFSALGKASGIILSGDFTE
jgi:hypothetical protein